MTKAYPDAKIVGFVREAIKHTSEAFVSSRHFEDAIKKVKGQKEMKPEEKINLSHYR
jgi:transitional endoplasmic reticulum ATPase